MLTALLYLFFAIWFIPPMVSGTGILVGYMYEQRIPLDLRPWLGFLFALTCIPYYGVFLVTKLLISIYEDRKGKNAR